MIELRTERLAHSFEERRVFGPLSYSFDGPALAITGPNGSGKSTLLRIIAGLLTASEGGTILSIDGKPLGISQKQASFGFASPDVALYGELTAQENMELLLRFRGGKADREQAISALETVGLADRAGDFYRELSTGLKQRLKIAAAIVHSPPVLLLDEPGSNLDEDGRSMIYSLIEKHKLVGMVILATNDPMEAQLAQAAVDLG